MLGFSCRLPGGAEGGGESSLPSTPSEFADKDRGDSDENLNKYWHKEIVLRVKKIGERKLPKFGVVRFVDRREVMGGKLTCLGVGPSLRR